MIQDSDINQSNLISKYGRLTVDKIKFHNKTFISKQSKQDQKYVQMYHFISNLLTKAEQLNIIAESRRYTMQGIPVGDILFKMLIQNLLIDTLSAYIIQRVSPELSLTTLEAYVATVNSNIYTFNKHVKSNLEGLKRNGWRTDDIINNLFKACHI